MGKMHGEAMSWACTDLLPQAVSRALAEWRRDAAVLVSSPMQFLASPPSLRVAKQASPRMLSQRINPLLQWAGGRTPPTISGSGVTCFWR